MKKIERGAQFFAQNKELFRCPTCRAPFSKVEKTTVYCIKEHQFDLSKKGTLYLIKHGVKSDYDNDAMWQARRTLLQAGFFDPIVEEITNQIGERAGIKVLDIGCGEGSVLQRLEHKRADSSDRYVGFDISKRAINLATQQETAGFFCIADLADLPFSEQSFDYLLDIFSPSAYSEFARVQKKTGKLLKVIPNANYLGELQRLLYAENDEKHEYSNQKVWDLFYKHYPKATSTRIKYDFSLDDTLFAALMKMTPLQWGASAERLQKAASQPLKRITVDVTLLSGEK